MTLDAVFPAQATALVVPSQHQRKVLLALERTEANHLKALASLPGLTRLEAPASALGAPLVFPFTAVAWNLERCHVLAPSLALLQTLSADIVLLSEMDNGMARTGQKHTTRDMAAGLGKTYAYGVEFLELDLGPSVQRVDAVDAHNQRGFHGNALLASTALQNSVLIRLPDNLHWFADAPRVGTRCAVAAVIATTQGPICAVSVHLESRGDARHRADQMRMLLDTVDALYGPMPVLLGGDFNTGLADCGDFEKETLFSEAAARGYQRHSGRLDEKTTRPSRFSPPTRRQNKLDWFLTRSLEVSQSTIVPALSPDGTVLSDHELVTVEVTGITAHGGR